MSDSDDDEPICPLCIQPLDATDRAINYCLCGYQMCLWCWHQLMETASKENLAGRCPNCRTIYDKEKIEMHSITPELLEEERRKKKEEKKKGNRGIPKSKQDLAHIRVVQRNLVYAVGLPFHICREEMLAERQYFGQFGKTKKISVNRGGMFAQGQGKTIATGSAYVTFTRTEDAVRCIEALDGSTWEGKPIRACFGTTKYCNAFLKGVVCNNPDCLYLHDIANEDDSFNKDDMNNGTLSKHIQQLVMPLAGDRSKGAGGLSKVSTPLPPPFVAVNGGAGPSEGSTMTQLGKPQAGPSVNPWTTHQLHIAAPVEQPPSPVRGVPKPPPGPNLADQEWPSLAAAMEDSDKDRPGAADNEPKVQATNVLSRTSSLTGDLTVADAVKAAIAAATKPAPKQPVVSKPSAQTITLTKPTKNKTAASVVKAKMQSQFSTVVQPSVSEATTSTITVAAAASTPPLPAPIPVPAAVNVTTVAAGSAVTGRVAAAVEAALQPPSPSPSYQQAAVASITTKASKGAAAGRKGINSNPQTPTKETPTAASTAAASQSSTTPDDKAAKQCKKVAVAPATPPTPSEEGLAAAPQTSNDSCFMSATTSFTEPLPLSRASSISSATSAPTTEPMMHTNALTITSTTAPATPATTTSIANVPSVSHGTLFIQDDLPASSQVVPVSDLLTSLKLVSASSGVSSASLANWLHASDSRSSPVAAPTSSVTPVMAMAGPSLDPSMDAAVEPPFIYKPTVPPGFDVPTAGVALLKQLSTGPSASARGPPPGFSQPWQAPATALSAAPNSFDVNMFFNSDADVAEAPLRHRKQSRFRFAQNGTPSATELDGQPSISDFRNLGLPGLEEESSQQVVGELNLFRKIFPTAKLNLVPAAPPPQPAANGLEHATAPANHSPWAGSAGLPSAAGHVASTAFSIQQLKDTQPNGPLGGSLNPGLALLQQLQRAARGEPLAPVHNPSPLQLQPPPQHIPLVNLYTPPPTVSQPHPPSFQDPAIINAKAAPDIGLTSAPPPQPPTVWPPGFGSMPMQHAPPSASLHAPAVPVGSQPMPMYQQQQHSTLIGDSSMYGYLFRQGGLAQQQQPQYNPQGIPAIRAQQRGPPPGFNPGNTAYNPAYSDYSNSYSVMQPRPPPPANSHMFTVNDHYQPGTNLVSNGTDVTKGYLFPTRI